MIDLPGSKPQNSFVGWRLVVRQLINSPSVAVTTFATVALTGLFLIGAPIFLEVLSDRALQTIVSEADPGVKNIQMTRATTIPVLSGETPFQRVERVGDDFREREFGPNTASLVESVEYVVESPRFAVQSGPAGQPDRQIFLRLLHQSGLEGELRLEAGSLPTERDPALALSGNRCDPFFDSMGERRNPPELLPHLSNFDCEVVEVPLFEAAFTREALLQMGLEIGDRVSIAPDPTEFASFGNVPGNQLEYEVFVEIAGVITPVRPDADYWYGDLGLHRPRLVETPDFEIVYATGLVAQEAYRSMLSAFRPANWHYTWRYFIDASSLDPQVLGSVEGELRALQIGFPPASPFGPGEPTVSTGLPDLIDAFFDQRRLAYSTMAMSGAGLLVTSTAVVLLMAALASVRDRPSLILVRSRGGTPGQLLTARTAHGLLLTAPAIAVAYLTTWAIARGNDIAQPYLGAVAVAGASLGAFVVTIAPSIRPSLGQLLAQGIRPPRVSARRVVAETALVVAAIAITLLLRRRFEAGPPEDAPFDVMLAVAPIVLGAAVGIVTLRLIGLPVRGLGLLAARGRGPVLFVGLRRVLQLSSVAKLPMIAVVAATALSVFSAVLFISIEEGQVEAAFQAVGADYSVTPRSSTGQLSGDYGLTDLEQVSGVARAWRVPEVSARLNNGAGSDSDTLELIALDVGSYTEVTDGTSADLALQGDVLATIPGDDAPVPALVSPGLLNGATPGSRFTVSGGGISQVLDVRGTLSRFPRAGGSFVVVDLASLEASLDRTLPTTELFISASTDAASSIRENVSERTSNAIVRSQEDHLERARTNPFVRGVNTALVVGSSLALVFGVVAGVGSLALTGPERRRDLGYLRTLGLTSRQALGVTAIEQVPTITIAAAVGGLLGAVLAIVFEPGLDLHAFTGEGVVDPIRVHPPLILAITVALVGAMVIGVIAFAALARRRDLGQLLRLGDPR